jgi:hypothetical protein
MSIIHDALKKVQQTNNAGTPTPTAPYQDPFQPPQQEKPQDKISIPLLVAVICAIVAMVFAALPQLAPRRISALPAPAATTQAPAAPEQKTPEPKPVAAAPKTSSSAAVSKAVANAVASPVMPAIKPSTQKIVDPNDPLSSIRIEGVMDLNGKKTALINGNVYEEGQTIYGKIISEITFDSLTVIDNGHKRIFSSKP